MCPSGFAPLDFLYQMCIYYAFTGTLVNLPLNTLSGGLEMQEKPTIAQILRAKEILGVDYRPHDMCVRCALQHHDDKGLSFNIGCKPLRYGEDEYKIKNNDDIWVAMLKDPQVFATTLGIELRDFQRDIMLCRADRKVLRITRQAGKTWSMALSALYYAFTHKRARVLIVAPYDSQTLNLFNTMSMFIESSPIIAANVKTHGTTGRYYTKDPYTMRFTNGSRIMGFAVGQKKGTNARGSSADLIIIDEMDYMNKEALVAIMAIMAGNSKTKLIAASTPSGIRADFYEACHSPNYKEFHYSYNELSNYSNEMDAEFKRTMTKEDYEREILAEFTLHESGVFADKFIDASLTDIDYEIQSDGRSVYTIGVDWNETATGVQIVTLRYDVDIGKFVVARTDEMPPSEFTQLDGVEMIKELNERFQPRLIYVDNGFGETQIQLLKKIGVEHPDTHLSERVHGISFAGKVELVDPVTHAKVEHRTKNLMVSLSVRYLERGMLALPRREDMPRSLVGQMRRYEIAGFAPDGAPKYSHGNDHKLDAFVLALYAMWRLSPDSDASQRNTARTSAVINPEKENNKYVTSSAVRAKHTIHSRLHTTFLQHAMHTKRW